MYSTNCYYILFIVLDLYHLLCMVINCKCLLNIINSFGWLLTVILGY